MTSVKGIRAEYYWIECTNGEDMALITILEFLEYLRTKLYPNISKATVVTIVSVMLAVLADAGYVDLYRDADFKHKLTRVDDVVLDACYRFTCKDLDNAITSAKWPPETGSYFEGGLATIAFFTGTDCNETAKH